MWGRSVVGAARGAERRSPDRWRECSGSSRGRLKPPPSLPSPIFPSKLSLVSIWLPHIPDLYH